MKLVFFDIDGTLASGTEVPLSAQKAVQMLRHNGSQVWICTGRTYVYARQHFHDYADGYIVSNGREGYASTGKIFERPIALSQLQIIKTRLEQIQAGYALFDDAHGHYYGPEEGYAAMASVWDPGFVVHGGDLQDTKIYNLEIWYRSQAHYEQIAAQLKEIAVLNLHGSHPSADATIIGWDKGDALKEAASYLHVPQEDTYAFGDGMNDICMLKAAGHGIAMGNGQQEVKSAASYVTASISDDGVLRGLQHYHLI